MQDNNVIKSIDQIINLIIIGIIIQFGFIIINTGGRDNFKSYSMKFDASSITYFKSELNISKIPEKNTEILKQKINVFSKNVLEKKKEDILVIKVNTEVKNIVKTAKEVLEKEKVESEQIAQKKEIKKEIPSVWHRVKKGESLSYIASLYDISVSDMKAINSLKTDTIFEGQKIKITKTEGIDYKVQKGDSLWVISRKYNTSVKDLMETNKIDNYSIKVGDLLKVYPGEKWFLAKKRTNSKFFSWPLDNKITSPYGYRMHPVYSKKIFHSGVDIRGGIGESIKAAASGTVIYSGNKGGYGKVVMIKHSRGYETRYGHCSKLLVKVGDKVKKGQIIANVGNTGLSTGPHLHFEVRQFDKTQNPLKFK